MLPREPALIRRVALASAWCGSWTRGGTALIVLCLCMLLPGLFSLPPIDRDESRFAQASRQMMESGDYIVPRVQDRPRINKPPLVYWLQAGTVQALTRGHVAQDSVWMYRVPGALCMIATVLLTWRLGCSMFDARVGWVGAALLGICPLVVLDAHQARADQLLLATVAASQFCLWKVLRLRAGTERSWWMRNVWVAALWLCVGLGVLAKGPITPLVVALTILAFCTLRRDWMLLHRVRPLLGVVMILGMVLPWVLAVTQDVGWSRYWHTVYDETIGRSTQAKEGHIGPPGYHLVLLVVLFFPGSLLTGLAVTNAWKRGAVRAGAWWRWKWAGKSAELYLLAWALPAWAVFELVLTKLPHYTMPLYPALALLTARTALASTRTAVEALRAGWTRAGFLAWGAVAVVIVAGVPSAAAWWLSRSSPDENALPGLGVGVAGLVLAIAATWYALRTRPVRAYVLGALALAGTYVVTLQLLLPANDDMLLSVRIAETLNAGTNQFRPCAAVGYQEDSLVFLTRGRVQRIQAAEAAAWTRSHPDGMLVVSKKDGVSVERMLPELEVTGFNYARSKRESVQVLTREAYQRALEESEVRDPAPDSP